MTFKVAGRSEAPARIAVQARQFKLVVDEPPALGGEDQGANPVEYILAGFAGGTADAFTLFERFEGKLEAHQGHIMRAAVELAKDWRTDRILRRLEAMLVVANEDATLIITGAGDVIEPEQGIAAIGSGGSYAQAAARALLENTDLSSKEIVKKALTIAGDICIYTNQDHVIEFID